MASPTSRTFYDVRGVERHANKSEIKVAYHKLALQRHPDKNHGTHSTVADFQELAEAYEILSDENRRVLYDKKLREGASLPSKSTESSVAARARAYMMHRAEELKRERQARERAAEKARKEREERERAAEKARKEQEARERAAEKAWKEQEAREREAEKAKKEQDARERAANLAKDGVARAEQEWILGIKATIKLMLTMRSSVQTLEAEVWQMEQRGLDIVDDELRAECRAKNSTTIWERSPEGLEEEHARKRKDRLMQLMEQEARVGAG